MKKSVEKSIKAYSRVYDVLKNRENVIAAFKRKRVFDNEAARELLDLCEKRCFRGQKESLPKYPDDTLYEAIAQCANDFAVFDSPISRQDIIDFRDGTLQSPLAASNMAWAVFFLSLLARLHYLPRNWKKLTVNKQMLVWAKTGNAPKIEYLYSRANIKDAGLYLDDEVSSKHLSTAGGYENITQVVKAVVENAVIEDPRKC